MAKSSKLGGSDMNNIYLVLGVIGTLVFGASAHCERVSMLEETRDIECSFAKGNPSYDRLLVERKEKWIEAYKDGKPVRKFERYKFLDSAFLVQAENSGAGALLQIFMNGTVTFTEGEILPLFEKNCDDTGAS